MNLNEKSERVKEELEKLGKKFEFTVKLPKSLDEQTQEWQYLITYERLSGVYENIQINVHREYIDVFNSLPPDRFDGVEQVKNAIEWIEGFLRNPR